MRFAGFDNPRRHRAESRALSRAGQRTASLVVVAVAAGAVAAQESPTTWSRFRGPNGAGVAAVSDLPVAFSPEHNVVWKTPLPPGNSSPILSAEHVFVTAFEGDELLTLCVDRATGAVVWRRAVLRERELKLHDHNSPASPSPAVDADTVVAFFQDFGLVAYDHDGSERWRRPMGPFRNRYGLGASPILVDGRVVQTVDQRSGSFLIALAARDGETIWRTERPTAWDGYATPAVYDTGEDAKQLVIPSSFLLEGFDLASGKRLWWVRGIQLEPKAVPVIHGDLALVPGAGPPRGEPEPLAMAEYDADDDGRIARDEMPDAELARAQTIFTLADGDADGFPDAEEWENLLVVRHHGLQVASSRRSLLAIRIGGRGDRTDAAYAWTRSGSIPEVPAAVVAGGAVFVVSDEGGVVTKIDAATGDLIGRRRLPGGIGRTFASPVAGDGKVYLVSHEGTVTVLDAQGDLEPLAVNELGDPCYATPALADGRIFLRTARALYAFGYNRAAKYED